MTLFRSGAASEHRGSVSSGSPTYNPFENPSVPLASVGLDTVFGSSNNDAGQTVTTENSFAVPTVYRCISLLATVVAGCPLNVYRRGDKSTVNFALFDQSNDAMTYTQYELWELVVTHLAGWGNAYVYKKRDAHDSIVDLMPLHPSFVEVKLDKDSGEKIFLVKKDGETRAVPFTTFEIMHIPGLGYNGLTGLSPLAVASQAIGTAMAADKLAARFYSSGSQLGGILKVKAPLRSKEQADKIKSRWMAKNAGVSHAGDIAVLDAETDFQTITIPPEQLQFLESRRWQTTELARVFGIPPHLVGDVEKSTSWGTGIEQQNLGFVGYTIAGWTNRIEQRATRELLTTRGHYSEFDLDRLLRGSTQERYEAYAKAAGGPWMTRTEVRAKENMNPLPDHPEYDELLPPQGAPPIGDNGAPDDPDDTTSTKEPVSP